MTLCNSQSILFSSVGRRAVPADFAGGSITSDAGALLLREADRRLELVDLLDTTIPDPRNPSLITHQQATMLRHRTLFDTMDEGFVVIEVEFDSSGRATDFRHLEANPAFEKHTGLRDCLGQSVRQTVPGLEEFWFETYGRVASTGEPTRFEHMAGPLNRRFVEYASRLGGPGSRPVAVLFTDITVRRQAEEAIRASEARNSYLVKLADMLRPLSDPIAVQAEASRVLGEDLQANRVIYFQIRGDEYVIERDYTTGTQPLAGR